MIDELCQRFATKVQEARIAKGLSKGQLASLADLEISYIGKIERCEKFPNIKTIIKLAKALEVPVKDLFDF